MKLNYSAIIILFAALFLYSCSEDGPTSPQQDHFEAAGLILLNLNNDTIMKIHEGQFDPAYNTKITLVPLVAPIVFKVEFLNEEGEVITDPDEDNTLNVLIDDESVLVATYPDGEPWQVGLQGLKQGNTEIEVRLLHGDHPDFKTPKIPVEVQ